MSRSYFGAPSSDASGNTQHFHVKVPVTYKLPSFSPNWRDYIHGIDNETIVVTDSRNSLEIKVYSEAQLQLLWQAFFIETLEQDQQSTYQDVMGKKFKVFANTYNTVLYTYPNMYHIPSDYVPDLVTQ